MKTAIFLLPGVITLSMNAQSPTFIEISESAGVNNLGANHGVAIGDFDNDGDEDIYVSRTNNETNLLYENLGDFIFREIGYQAAVDYAGTTSTAIWGDIDNDGNLDLYLGNKNSSNVLYYNNGDGTFTDISISAKVNDNKDALSIYSLWRYR